MKRQAELLELSRSSVYYAPRAISERDLMLMRRIDELHSRRRSTGRASSPRSSSAKVRSRSAPCAHADAADGDRSAVPKAAYQHPGTRGAGVSVFAGRDLLIERPNQVWASDISYVPMAHGFMYLVAILDVASRKVLAWRLSNTMTTDFCLEALEEATEQVRQAGDLQHRPGISIHHEEWITTLRVPASRSAWMARAAGSITCLSSGCGAA